MSERRIAAFDFDGTLTRRDTLLPFLVWSCGARRVAQAVAVAAPGAARARVSRLEQELHHRDVTKVALVRQLFGGREASWLAERGEEFAHTLDARLRPSMVDRLDWHRGRGHELVIVSASLAAYLKPFAARQGVDHVIAVEPAVGDDGRLTGELAHPNVRGAEKERRLRRWFGDAVPVELWAYGNSSGDRELLAMADHATWIR